MFISEMYINEITKEEVVDKTKRFGKAAKKRVKNVYLINKDLVRRVVRKILPTNKKD